MGDTSRYSRADLEMMLDGARIELDTTQRDRDALRARLERAARERDEARAALGKALKGLPCHVSGLPAELCGCKFCRGLQAALGAAGERGEDTSDG
jgi:hypothetical protein